MDGQMTSDATCEATRAWIVTVSVAGKVPLASCAEHGQQMAPDHISALKKGFLLPHVEDADRKCFAPDWWENNVTTARDPQALGTSCWCWKKQKKTERDRRAQRQRRLGGRSDRDDVALRSGSVKKSVESFADSAPIFWTEVHSVYPSRYVFILQHQFCYFPDFRCCIGWLEIRTVYLFCFFTLGINVHPPRPPT